jgi:hypothetical protein
MFSHPLARQSPSASQGQFSFPPEGTHPISGRGLTAATRLRALLGRAGATPRSSCRIDRLDLFGSPPGP